MRKRDKDIVTAIEKFRCLTRDQMAAMFYSHTKNPATNCNYALKRLRDRGYIVADTNRTPYVYFPSQSKLKKDSQKVEHFLKIADFYLDLLRNGWKIRQFDIEPRYEGADVRPDIFTIANGSPFFVEIQNSVYSTQVMTKKIKLYERFYDSGYWRSFDWQPADRAIFPFVWIVGENTYKVTSDKFRIVQSKNVANLMRQIKPKKPASAPQPVQPKYNGGIKINIG
jgi:hypothetical protein